MVESVSLLTWILSWVSIITRAKYLTNPGACCLWVYEEIRECALNPDDTMEKMDVVMNLCHIHRLHGSVPLSVQDAANTWYVWWHMLSEKQQACLYCKWALKQFFRYRRIYSFNKISNHLNKCYEKTS